MSKALHGDPTTNQMDQYIRGMLEVLGYKVIVVQSRPRRSPGGSSASQEHRSSPWPVRSGRGDPVRSSYPISRNAPRSGLCRQYSSRSAARRVRRLAEEALNYCNENCRRHIQTCIDHDCPLPVVGFELQDDEGRVCADAELAWEDRLLAVLLPERAEGMEAFQQQGWTVFLSPDLTDEQLRELLSE